ncbi:MAG: DUF2480 family protein [Crocinitomix sp.]|nr:DUF2480 family protein [Crocinitomix sp.]
MEGEIVNKVANAGIEQIDLIDFVNKGELVGIDLKDLLWNELVLREKEFRAWVKDHDWVIYAEKHVYIYCSNDAIVPAWAYMLLVSNLQNATSIIYGNQSQAQEDLFFANLNNWDISDFVDKRVMVKGCSAIPNPNKAYVVLTNRLVPIVKNLMFGEPCSAVPVYKKKKK